MNSAHPRRGSRLGATPVSFSFDGRRLVGMAGDTAASALLANGVQGNVAVNIGIGHGPSGWSAGINVTVGTGASLGTPGVSITGVASGSNAGSFGETLNSGWETGMSGGFGIVGTQGLFGADNYTGGYLGLGLGSPGAEVHGQPTYTWGIGCGKGY